jgi:hypothetical protein
MNRHDDFSNESDGSPTGSRDPLADRLRNEAMAGRPPFSRELHHRIMERVRGTDLALKLPRGIGHARRLATAAAALIVAALGLTALRIEHSHRASMRTHSMTMADHVPSPTPNAMQPAIPAAALPAFLTVDVGGVFSARFWPPEIIVSLPMAQSSPPHFSEQLPAQAAPAIGLPGSPEWLLARLQEQTNNAQAALADVIPPEVRVLLRQSND